MDNLQNEAHEQDIQKAKDILLDIRLKPYSVENLERYFRSLVYVTESGNPPVSFSYKLFADNYDAQSAILSTIESAIKEINPNLVMASVKEASLLKDPSLIEKAVEKANIIAITDCTDSPMSDKEQQAWNSVIANLEFHPELTRFLCASKETFQNRFHSYGHLYYRVFRYDIVQKDLSVENIEEILHNRLQKRGLEPSEEFDEAMHAYLQDIWEKADLKSNAFLDDLEERVVTLHALRLPDTLLVAEDVPFHKAKTNDIPAVQPSGRTNAKEDTQTEIDHTKEIEWPTLNLADPGLSSLPLDPDNKAAILLFLSDFHLPRQEDMKINPDGYMYNAPAIPRFDAADTLAYAGGQTNDAAIQYLIDCAHVKHQYITQILCITSRKVKDEKLSGTEETAYSRFEKRVRDYLTMSGQDENARKCRFVQIPYDYDDSVSQDTASPDLMNNALRIFSRINKAVSGAATAAEHYYIDFSGGLRDTNFMIVAVMRFLEFFGHSCEKIVYDNLPRDHKNPQIVDMGYLYDIFQLINGTGDFVTNGSARQLRDIFREKDISGGAASEMINAMIEFSDTVQLCDVDHIDAAAENVVNSMNSFARPENGTLKELMLHSMIPLIQDKLYLKSNIWAADSGKRSERYLKLIEWCLDNELYQQALTFYVEKMPVVYYERHLFEELIDYRDSLEIKNRSATVESDGLYNLLYGKIRMMPLDLSDYFYRLKDVLNALGNKLKELGWDSPSYTDINMLAGSLNTFSGYPIVFSDRFKKFIKRLERTHVENGKIIFLLDSYSFAVNVKNSRKNNIANFFLDFYKNSKLRDVLRHYLVYHDVELLNEYNASTDDFSPFDTYTMKAYAVYVLDSGRIPDSVLKDQQRLKLIMGCYLAAKILRNSIDHAEERSIERNVDPEDRDKAVAALESMNFHDKNGDEIHLKLQNSDGKYTAENIHHILSVGLDVSESMQKFEFHPQPLNSSID